MSHLSPIPTDDYAYYVDPEDDRSGLLAWVEDDGRFFCVNHEERVVEVRDGDPMPLLSGEAPNEKVNRRLGLAIYVFVALSTLMFVGQFVRAYLAGRF